MEAGFGGKVAGGWAAWNAGEPNNSNGGSSEDFAEFQFGGGFNDIIDGTYTQMLVEFPANDDTPIAEDEVVLGSNRFVRYRTRGGMSWTELQDFAVTQGGQLACFETEAELDAAVSTRRQLARRCALGHRLGASTGQYRTGWRMGLDQPEPGLIDDLRPVGWCILNPTTARWEKMLFRCSPVDSGTTPAINSTPPGAIDLEFSDWTPPPATPRTSTTAAAWTW